MPQITLDLVSLDGKPLLGLTRSFEGSGGTIGRDEGNTLALPDTHRRVSRLHAAVSFPGGVATITNSSAALPILVGGRQLECGQALALLPGMEVEIGPYVLVVRQTAAMPPPLPAPVPIPVQMPAPMPAPAAYVPPYAAPPPIPTPAPAYAPRAMPAPSGGGDPFADLLGIGAMGTGPSASVLPPAPAYAPPEPTYAPAPLGFDDPLAGLLGSAGPAALPSAGSGGGVGGGAGADPFAALGLGPGPSAAQLPAAYSPPSYAPPAYSPPPPAYAPPASVIPDDFNPFDMPSASARNSADPLLSMLGGADAPGPHALTQGEQSIDALFAPSGGGSSDLLGGGSGGYAASPFGGGHAAASFGAASLIPEGDSSDPLALFGSAAPSAGGFAKPMRDDLAEIGGAYQPPRALQPAAPAPAFSLAPPASAPVFAPPAQAVAMSSYPADALTQAFLTGAKLSPSALPNGLTPEIMTIVGSLLHSATGGAIELLGIRANIKREVQANVTIISSQANNPLKFLPDADSALQQFLGKKIPGFMRPDEAMKDAFNDLRAHELGVMAGTRAALGEVLGKFDPAILEGRLIGGSLLERALPAMRKTKLWDLYLERYALIRREAEDDFQSIFGEAFMKAYERETARMKAQGSGRAP